MKPKEFKRIRHELYASQAAAARALGVSRMTVCRWENGTRRIPEIAAKLLRRLYAEKEELDAGGKIS